MVHFTQWEMEMASFTRDGGAWTEYTLAECNMKYGLTDRADLQLVLPLYTHVRGGDEAYFNTGFTWAVADLWQVDGGIRVGFTNASADLTPFLGLSHKF